MTIPRHAGRTALIVEDDEGIMAVLCDALEDEGFTTSRHTVGRSAAEALSQQSFDVMVIDVNLPDMNGLALCAMAREQHGVKPVILVISGIDVRRRAMASLQLEADDFLGKPFDLDEFLERIQAKLQWLPPPSA